MAGNYTATVLGLNGGALVQLEPIAALAAPGGALVQPHPVDNSRVLFAHATHDPRLEARGHQVWAVLRAGTALENLHVEWVLKI